MNECEIGQGLLGNSVARAMGGAVQDATLPAHRHAPQRDTDLLTTLLIRGGKGVYPWLAMLRDHLTNTTDAYQLNRLRTAERPTGLIV